MSLSNSNVHLLSAWHVTASKPFEKVTALVQRHGPHMPSPPNTRMTIYPYCSADWVQITGGMGVYARTC